MSLSDDRRWTGGSSTAVLADPLGAICPECPHAQCEHDLPGLKTSGCSHLTCDCQRSPEGYVRYVNDVAATLRHLRGGPFADGCLDVNDQEDAVRTLREFGRRGFVLLRTRVSGPDLDVWADATRSVGSES